MRRLFHNRSTDPWEVVDAKAVEPVSAYTDEEIEGTYPCYMEVMGVHSQTLHGTYMFDLKTGADLRRAVVFARQRLLQEAAEKEYNLFLTEGWSVTQFRKGKRHRVEVRYVARPAYAVTKKLRTPPPPFLAMLGGKESL
ncbi:uncharacterized protein TRAVEDRAFT_109008 [Trametes versicolor FP-101664 SS1]|uniref:uncharacterized protein n=1 Tax=Trametes versicolor (strain FP-101664) TaxID=717944 RepID=UPI0004622C71|nr:uncharacterized protein TRAVEDRAFT_109008 [Trametes versicolor FP-101664 SS1]EIW64882.1 hypothetical protein TRAVEDRAFT_109008 [Trametes versicolor FP-101664 SS1]